MFGSGKIQMLQSQINDLNSRLDQAAREKTEIEKKLEAANSAKSEIEQKAAELEKRQTARSLSLNRSFQISNLRILRSRTEQRLRNMKPLKNFTQANSVNSTTPERTGSRNS